MNDLINSKIIHYFQYCEYKNGCLIDLNYSGKAILDFTQPKAELNLKTTIYQQLINASSTYNGIVFMRFYITQKNLKTLCCPGLLA